jgi:hypothetical protein
MISLRVWLDRFPSQVRLLVALLSMLAFVAPTWHVCLGGHVREHGAATMVGMNHTPFARSKSGALVCFCAAKPAPEKPVSASHVNGRMSMSHGPNCLALMLAGMPALLASTSHLEVVSRLSFQVFSTRREFPAREFIRTFCGRGPPVNL